MTTISEQDIISQTNSYVDSLIKMILDDSVPYTPGNSRIFFVIGQFRKDLLEIYKQKSSEPEFWGDSSSSYFFLNEEPIYIWYLLKNECKENQNLLESIDGIKNFQTMEGLFPTSNTHSEAMRVLILIEPESTRTKGAIKYFIENWKTFNVADLSIGVLALSEANFFAYETIINEICNFILSTQREDGCFCTDDHLDYKIFIFDDTAYAIIALSRFNQCDKGLLLKGITWLIENIGNRSGFYPDVLALLIHALISVGGGPKVSLSEYEWKQELQKQKIDYMRPYFIHTSPLYQSKIHVKELHEIISSAIATSQRKIYICSLYIDILYEDIINKVENNPDLEIKIITRPSSQITGMREKIARNVLHLLNVATKGNLRTSEYLHSRMIIIDDNELIISSADLTRDQLFDEFNAGIHTKDTESIVKANAFFENLWAQSNKIAN